VVLNSGGKKKKRKKKKKKKIPKIAATFVFARSQGAAHALRSDQNT
jgi:hypothetical protein